MNAARVRVDFSFIPTRNGHMGDAERENLTVTACDADPIGLLYVFQEGEMRVTMRGVDRRALLARLWCVVEVSGTEGERLAARTFERYGGSSETRNLYASHRPGVGPAPGFDRRTRREGSRKGALQQDLRNTRLGINPSSLSREEQTCRDEDACCEGGKERAGALPVALIRVPAVMPCSFVTRRPEAKRRATEQTTPEE